VLHEGDTGDVVADVTRRRTGRSSIVRCLALVLTLLMGLCSVLRVVIVRPLRIAFGASGLVGIAAFAVPGVFVAALPVSRLLTVAIMAVAVLSIVAAAIAGLLRP
jgi:hypothetical protein